MRRSLRCQDLPTADEYGRKCQGMQCNEGCQKPDIQTSVPFDSKWRQNADIMLIIYCHQFARVVSCLTEIPVSTAQDRDLWKLKMDIIIFSNANAITSTREGRGGVKFMMMTMVILIAFKWDVAFNTRFYCTLGRIKYMQLWPQNLWPLAKQQHWPNVAGLVWLSRIIGTKSLLKSVPNTARPHWI